MDTERSKLNARRDVLLSGVRLAAAERATRASLGLGDRPVEPSTGEPFKPVAAAGRNYPCPCGSGKKFKKCCAAGAVTSYRRPVRKGGHDAAAG